MAIDQSSFLSFAKRHAQANPGPLCAGCSQTHLAENIQNILCSTDVATLFLDEDLKVCYYTPTTHSFFPIVPEDLGHDHYQSRLSVMDPDFHNDAINVLRLQVPIEREIKTDADIWYVRRTLPYISTKAMYSGVVVTFNDITERKAVEKALQAAKLEAERANRAKSRFLAAASHDLRQPLQSLALLQGLLANLAEGPGATKLVNRLDVTLEAMSGMLNSLLDINQFEAGIIKADICSFAIGPMLQRLKEEFSYLAQARGLEIRLVPTTLWVRSDPALLEQIIRNLVSNAIKYTKSGRILIGCRHLSDRVVIKIWDTGIGIEDHELLDIFDEYHQVDNNARARSLGLGLGLSIVRRMSRLLGHPIGVDSIIGQGSAFSIELPRCGHAAEVTSDMSPVCADLQPVTVAKKAQASILVIEDDPEVRELLELILKTSGFGVVTTTNGPEGVAYMALKGAEIDLILADFNLPCGMNGLQTMLKVRTTVGREVPVIILTGDISTQTLRDIAAHACIHLNKPVKFDELLNAIERVLKTPIKVQDVIVAAKLNPVFKPAGHIYVIDDDRFIREGIGAILESEGFSVSSFNDGESFLNSFDPDLESWVLIDAYLPGIDGLELLMTLRKAGHDMPVIMITGQADITMAVSAMKAGAFDFLEKPISATALTARVKDAYDLGHDTLKRHQFQADAAKRISGLTGRQLEIMHCVLNGEPSKNIAQDLNISQRTVENHRAAIMSRTGAKSLPALARLVLAAGQS